MTVTREDLTAAARAIKDATDARDKLIAEALRTRSLLQQEIADALGISRERVRQIARAQGVIGSTSRKRPPAE